MFLVCFPLIKCSLAYLENIYAKSLSLNELKRRPRDYQVIVAVMKQLMYLFKLSAYIYVSDSRDLVITVLNVNDFK